MKKQQLKELENIADDLEELTGELETSCDLQGVILDETTHTSVDPYEAEYHYRRLKPLNTVLYARLLSEQKRIEEIFDRLHVALSEVVA